MNMLQSINDANKQLIEETIRLSKIVDNVELIHYQRETIEEAVLYHDELVLKIDKLKNLIRDIYDV